MGKRGRKAVFVEVDGKKGSKTFVGKGSKVTLCNACGLNDGKCSIQAELNGIAEIEAPVYSCSAFMAKVEEVEIKD
jgi:hypothetical protein